MRKSYFPIYFSISSVLFFSAFFAANSARAFPELIRHGYVNCLTCHVSPSGGGTLTDYGRTFSGEGLSSFTSKNEESLFEGLVPREKIPAWLAFGGDLRGVETFNQDSKQISGSWYWMQGDIEAAAKVKGFTFDLSLGRFQVAAEEPRLKARRFFAMYNFTEQWMVRVGRFVPVYGINMPDHIISTRMPLLFDQGQERYNVEASWITDTWSAVLTGSQGPVEYAQPQNEQSGEGQLAYAFNDTFKIGANGWFGHSPAAARNMGGVYALLGFTDELSLLSEVDYQWLTPTSGNTTQLGFFVYDRLGYEILHGFNLLASGEFWQTDLSDATTSVDRYGGGFEWFPRPHFDIQTLYTKQRVRGTSMSFSDYAWCVLHYYF